MVSTLTDAWPVLWEMDFWMPHQSRLGELELSFKQIAKCGRVRWEMLAATPGMVRTSSLDSPTCSKATSTPPAEGKQLQTEESSKMHQTHKTYRCWHQLTLSLAAQLITRKHPPSSSPPTPRSCRPACRTSSKMGSRNTKSTWGVSPGLETLMVFSITNPRILPRKTSKLKLVVKFWEFVMMLNLCPFGQSQKTLMKQPSPWSLYDNKMVSTKPERYKTKHSDNL